MASSFASIGGRSKTVTSALNASVIRFSMSRMPRTMHHLGRILDRGEVETEDQIVAEAHETIFEPVPTVKIAADRARGTDAQAVGDARLAEVEVDRAASCSAAGAPG